MDWIVAGFLYMMHVLGISSFSFWLKVNKVENGVAQINRLVLFSLSWLFLFFGPKRSSQVLAKSIILFVNQLFIYRYYFIFLVILSLPSPVLVLGSFMTLQLLVTTDLLYIFLRIYQRFIISFPAICIFFIHSFICFTTLSI